MTAGRTIYTKRQDWGTPAKYVNAVRDFFGGQILLDPCSSEYSIVNAETEWMLPDNDGLANTWNYRTIYVNPPYGKDHQRGTRISSWLEKCYMAHIQFGSEVLALVPVATNTSHWKNSVWGAANGICFLYDTRLKFLECGKDTGKGAPMSCAMIYWGQNFNRFHNVFITFGAVVNIESLMQSRNLGNSFAKNGNRVTSKVLFE
ncbi:N-6 DNA methylase [bacterium]|nr:N-6 DNA methylase [bacterium]